jgi:hypothetical protein
MAANSVKSWDCMPTVCIQAGREYPDRGWTDGSVPEAGLIEGCETSETRTTEQTSLRWDNSIHHRYHGCQSDEVPSISRTSSHAKGRTNRSRTEHSTWHILSRNSTNYRFAIGTWRRRQGFIVGQVLSGPHRPEEQR